MQKNNPEFYRLSPAYIEMVHDVVVSSLWAGDQPVTAEEPRDKGLLESASARPFQTFFGQELHADIFEQAGALFHALICNHPFFNGNKRTAVIVLNNFLLANRYYLALPNEAMYDLANLTATCNETGMGHDRVLSKIVHTAREWSVSLDEIAKQPDLADFAKTLEGCRASIVEWLRLNQAT